MNMKAENEESNSFVSEVFNNEINDIKIFEDSRKNKQV